MAKNLPKIIKKIVKSLCQEANYYIPKNILKLWLFNKSREKESLAKLAYNIMLKNAHIAGIKKRPLCQDTGQLLFFIEYTPKYAKIVKSEKFDKLIEEGVVEGSKEGYLRESMVNALSRETVGFLPIVIHKIPISYNNSEFLKLTVIPTGGGCEQVSCVEVLVPSNIEKNIKEFVINRVKQVGSLPCPPTFLGIGIGQTIETAGYLARKALYKVLTQDYKPTDFENELLNELNSLNIGPQGLGGKTTVFRLKLESGYCHRANLPIGLIFSCHLGRYRQVLLLDSNWQDFDKEEYLRYLTERIASINREELNYKRLELPLSQDKVDSLKIGELVLLNGIIYVARDLTHKKLITLIKEGKNLPVDLKNQVIYYAGPSPTRPGDIIGSIGPTTSKRMDEYTSTLLKIGLKGMIGKGERSEFIKDMIKEYKAVYFLTFGGAGAYLAEKVEEAEVVAYKELDCEALFKLKVKDFPCIVKYI